MKHIIYSGDTQQRIKEIKDNSIHLVISSPPYYNVKEYHKGDDNIGNNESYGQYLESIKLVLKELYRIVIPGGIAVWNTSPIIFGESRLMIPQDTHKLFIDIGFNCRDDITWKKPDGAAKLRCGGWVQNKGRPLTWHPNIVDEKVMAYVKGRDKREGEYDSIYKYYPEIPKDLLTNIWNINPETADTWHDAPFPEELVKRCILLYSYKGDTVFDPFLGSGTTSKVARDLGRNSIGIELSLEYIKKAKEKLGFYQKSLWSEEIYEER